MRYTWTNFLEITHETIICPYVIDHTLFTRNNLHGDQITNNYIIPNNKRMQVLKILRTSGFGLSKGIGSRMTVYHVSRKVNINK